MTHSLPEEQVDKCPATTGKGEPCQNPPKAEKVYCGSHKALEDYDGTTGDQELAEVHLEKKGKKARKKKDWSQDLGV